MLQQLFDAPTLQPMKDAGLYTLLDSIGQQFGAIDSSGTVFRIEHDYTVTTCHQRVQARGADSVQGGQLLLVPRPLRMHSPFGCARVPVARVAAAEEHYVYQPGHLRLLL